MREEESEEIHWKKIERVKKKKKDAKP